MSDLYTSVIDNLSTVLMKLDKSLVRSYQLCEKLFPRCRNYIIEHANNFDRYPDMASHSFTHILNLLYMIDTAFSSHIKREKYFNAEEFLILIVSAFLHDIGMSDISKTDLLSARKEHSLYTYRMLSGKTRSEAGIVVPEYRSSIADILLEDFSPSEREAIALVCKYHQSRWPLVASPENALISLEEELKSNPLITEGSFNGKPIYSCERLEELFEASRKDPDGGVNLLTLAAWLQVLDGCDVQVSRLGSRTYREKKKEDIFVRKAAKTAAFHSYLTKHGIPIPEEGKRIQKRGLSKQVYALVKEAEENHLNEIEFLQEQIEVHYAKHESILKVFIRFIPLSKPDSPQPFSRYYTGRMVEGRFETVTFNDRDSVNSKNILSIEYFPTERIESLDQKDPGSKRIRDNLLTFIRSVEKELEDTLPYLKKNGEYVHRTPSRENPVLFQILAHPANVMRMGAFSDKQLTRGLGFVHGTQGEIVEYLLEQKRPKTPSAGSLLKVVSAPSGAGKTTTIYQLIKQIAPTQRCRICLIKGEDFSPISNSRDRLRRFVDELNTFMIENNNFTIFNSVSYNLDFEAGHWEEIFRACIEQRVLLIIDDLHSISIGSLSDPFTRFLTSLFNRLIQENLPVLLFTQKTPSMLIDPEGEQYIPFEQVLLPGLKRSEFYSIIERSQKGSNQILIGDPPKDVLSYFTPHARSEKLKTHLQPLTNLPISLQILSGVTENLARTIFVSRVEGTEVELKNICTDLDAYTRYHIHSKIVKKMNSPEVLDLLEVFMRFAVPVGDASKISTVYSDSYEPSFAGVSHSRHFRELVARGIIFMIDHEGKRVWTVDDWWERSTLFVSSFRFWKKNSGWKDLSWREFLHLDYARGEQDTQSYRSRIESLCCEPSENIKIRPNYAAFTRMLAYLKDPAIVMREDTGKTNKKRKGEINTSLYPHKGEFLLFCSLCIEEDQQKDFLDRNKILKLLSSYECITANEVHILDTMIIGPFNSFVKAMIGQLKSIPAVTLDSDTINYEQMFVIISQMDNSAKSIELSNLLCLLYAIYGASQRFQDSFARFVEAHA